MVIVCDSSWWPCRSIWEETCYAITAIIRAGDLSTAARHAQTILLVARSVERWHLLSGTVEMQPVADDDPDNFTEMTGSRTAALQAATTWVDSSGECGSRVHGTELEMIEEENGVDGEGAVGLAHIPETERPALVLALKAAAEAAQPMCRSCSSVLQAEPAAGLGKDSECPMCPICLKIIDSPQCYHCATCCKVFCSSCQMSKEEREEWCAVASEWNLQEELNSLYLRAALEEVPTTDLWKRMASVKTPAELAVADGNMPIIASFTKGDLRLHPRLVHLAAENGHLEVVRLLIEKGADATAEDDDKSTPLHYAAENGHLEVVRLLIEKGADATAANVYKSTPLHFGGAENGHLEVVRLLIEKGADATAEEGDKTTPLHYAAESGHLEVVRLLIEKGADATAENYGKKTPLHYAAENGHLEVVRLLIEKGAGATAENYGKKTPLHFGAENGHLEVVRLLIEKGADATAEEGDKTTPLHYAAESGHLEVVRLLIEKGADATAANVLKWTPLHLAGNQRHSEVVRLLSVF